MSERAAQTESTSLSHGQSYDGSANTLLSSLSLEEKASLLAGRNYWFTVGLEEHGIPSIMLTDGPFGLRKEEGGGDDLSLNESVPATCFPSESTTACSFDRELLYEIGVALGEECQAESVSAILGPGLNMKRSPLCGRNFEYFSEDPLLAGELGAAQVAGIQSQGVGACLKHFAVNNQEKARMVSDSIVDERALHEIYLRAFEIAVRTSQPALVMGAYNRLNGSYCCENRELLQTILRDRWGFEGVVVSDWGAMSDSVASVAAGLDLSMPGPRPDHREAVIDAVRKGVLDEAAVDACCLRLLRLISRSHPTGEKLDEARWEAHLSLAARAAEESAVLLENEGGLPLDPHRSIAVIGAFAQHPVYQGAGSSRINPRRLDSLWEAMSERDLDLRYGEGYELESGEASDEQLAEAASLAAEADQALVVVGLPARYESEGYDRSSMDLPAGHHELVARVRAANPHTVVVVMAGSPVVLDWDPRPAAILAAYLGGCQGGHGLARLLLGESNPCGKLAETWPAALEDSCLGTDFPDQSREVRYRESVYLGYRYFDAASLEPAYCFGHGLSYSSFAYDDMAIGFADGKLRVSCTVSNEGSREGKEIVQAYLSPRDRGVFGPPKALCGFTKLSVPAQGGARAVIDIDPMSFAYWDPSSHDWVVEAGLYDIALGASSRDLRLVQTVELVEGQSWRGVSGPNLIVSAKGLPDARLRTELAPYYDPRPHGFTDEAFARLYGRAFPEPLPSRPFTMDSTVDDLKQSAAGRLIVAIVRKAAAVVMAKDGGDVAAMVDAMLNDMPVRSLLLSGALSAMQIKGLIDALNGHPLRGVKRFIGLGSS